MSDIVRELRAKVAELDHRLADWKKIKEERDQVQSLLDWYETNRGNVSLFQGVSQMAELRLVAPVDRSHLDKRFQPRPSSKTNQIALEAKRLLDALGLAELPFAQFVSSLPTHLQGGPPTWKEGVRTSIKRAGSRYGVMYDDGKIVRIEKAPKAESA